MFDAVILGYYGFKNSGDDALLLSIITQLKELKPDIRLLALSKNPEETARQYGVRSVKRDNPFALIWSLLTSKMLLCGGGTLIQDSTSTKSLLYYLYVIKLATMLGKKVMLYANGIGPLKEENHKITKQILNKVDLITLRDEMSLGELKNIGVTKPEIHLLADCAFGLELKKNNTQNAFTKKGDYFCVSVRSSQITKPDFTKTIAAVCDYVYEKYNCYPLFIPFQKSRDLAITNEIIALIHAPHELFDTECDIYELLGVMSEAKMCIGMRLHSLIYSVISNTPIAGLVYDPKISGFMDYIGQNNYLDATSVDENSLKTLCDNCFKNKDKFKEDLAYNLEIMRKKAVENSKLAIDLLNR